VHVYGAHTAIVRDCAFSLNIAREGGAITFVEVNVLEVANSTVRGSPRSHPENSGVTQPGSSPPSVWCHLVCSPLLHSPSSLGRHTHMCT